MLSLHDYILCKALRQVALVGLCVSKVGVIPTLMNETIIFSPLNYFFCIATITARILWISWYLYICLKTYACIYVYSKLGVTATPILRCHTPQETKCISLSASACYIGLTITLLFGVLALQCFQCSIRSLYISWQQSISLRDFFVHFFILLLIIPSLQPQPLHILPHIFSPFMHKYYIPNFMLLLHASKAPDNGHISTAERLESIVHSKF